MKNNFYKVSAFLLTGALPVVAFAQTSGVIGAIGNFQRILNAIIPVIITFGLLFFLFGVVQYILKPDDVAAARNIMLYGIIGLFVMVSVWGLVNLLADTFVSGGATSPRALPTVTPQ